MRSSKEIIELKKMIFVFGAFCLLSAAFVSLSWESNDFMPAVDHSTTILTVSSAIPHEEIIRGNVTGKIVTLTFDGGSVDLSGLQVLDILTERGLRGTFFLTGEFLNKYPDLVIRMSQEGHEIYNHTFSHPHLTELSNEEIKKELAMMDNSLIKLTGKSSKPFYRPPYGDRNLRVRRVANENGYTQVYWTIDAEDWRESEGITGEQVKSKIMSNISPGAIILMHLGDNITGEILGSVIDGIQKEGYLLVPLSSAI